MYEEKLEQNIREYFSAETNKTEPSLEWWDRTISNVTGENKRARRYAFTPRRRLAWVFLPLLLVLLISGTVYAASPVMREFFQKFTGHIENKGLVQEMNINQTIDGVTVSIQRAYADSNVILLGYMVSGPAKDYGISIGELSTADGYVFPGMVGFGTTPGAEGFTGAWGDNERQAMIMEFDTSKFAGTSAELNLKYEINISERTASGGEGKTAGPFTLAFTLPLNSGKIIEVNQTVEANGIPITLEKVEISPWVTRVDYKFKETNPTAVVMSLEIPTGNTDCKPFLTSQSGQYFLGDYTDKHGDCTVTINELVFRPDVTKLTEVPSPPGGRVFTGKAEDTKRLSGPWIFHFQVP